MATGRPSPCVGHGNPIGAVVTRIDDSQQVGKGGLTIMPAGHERCRGLADVSEEPKERIVGHEREFLRLHVVPFCLAACGRGVGEAVLCEESVL